MGIKNRKQIISIIEKQLCSDLRYRCLLFQSDDISVFPDICESASEAIEKLGQTPNLIDTIQMQDDVGAYSCNKVTAQILNGSSKNILILSGPLHFLDYWSKQEQSSFWGHLACTENSLGIIIIDVIRTEGVQETFRHFGAHPVFGPQQEKASSRNYLPHNNLPNGQGRI